MHASKECKVGKKHGRCASSRRASSRHYHPRIGLVSHVSFARRSSDWETSEEWGDENVVSSLEDDLDEYFEEREPVTSYGYEFLAGALAIALFVFGLKALFGLFWICFAIFATAFKYSVLAFVLTAAIIFIG